MRALRGAPREGLRKEEGTWRRVVAASPGLGDRSGVSGGDKAWRSWFRAAT